MVLHKTQHKKQHRTKSTTQYYRKCANVYKTVQEYFLLYYMLQLNFILADYCYLYFYLFIFACVCMCLFIAKPHWLQTMTATALSIEENLFWECKANGKPKPSYNWLKNGETLMSEVQWNC